jgi:cation diffusion facilitator family transporter
MEDIKNIEKPRLFASKESASILAIAATCVLIILKAAGSFITGSIGLRADAVHSVIDLSGAVIGFIGIRVAARPADKGHAFGHGKAESLSGAIIGLFILLAAGFIAYEAIDRLIFGGPIQMVDIGIYITIAAVIINPAVAWYVLRIAKRSDSIALEATGHDLLADSMSSLAVLAGLVIVSITGNYIFDAIVALLVSLVILRTAIITINKALNCLMDKRLPQHEEKLIRQTFENCDDIINYHALRTRKAGSERHIDVHIEVPSELTVLESHKICDRLEAKIKQQLPNSHIIIHVEPHE